jgi:IS5 family transposase
VAGNDSKEDGHYGTDTRGDELPPDVVGAQQRKEKLEKALAVLKERQAAAKERSPKDVSVVDPESCWVKKSGKVVRGYSGQVAADSEQQVIVALKATAQPMDFEQLNPMLDEVGKVVGQAPDQLVADSGYYTDDAVVQAAKGKTECFVPDSETAAYLNNPKRSETENAEFHVSRFTYDHEKDEFTCPQGKKLPFLKNHHRRTPTKIYRCQDCHSCPVQAQCTDHASGFRSIQLRTDHEQVRLLREKVKSETGKAIYKKRKAIIEPIFGRWQHNWGIRRLRLRGLTGFSAELHLLAIAHNLTKLIRFQQSFGPAAATV